tara:strand:- start:5292 stop:5540 length:249 start_codon:yes stop_codon:yes gene_type:complete
MERWIEIDKDVPIPQTSASSESYKQMAVRYLLKIDVGDSFIIEDRTRQTVVNWTMFAKRRNNDRDYTVRSESHTKQRIWRIK